MFQQMRYPIHGFLWFVLVSVFVAITDVGCSVVKGTSVFHLSGSRVKYWDAEVGHNWAFASDGAFLEYHQGSIERSPVDYDDLKITEMSFRVVDDSLWILAGQNRLWGYRIIALTREKLVVTSPSTGWGADTLTFKPSADQATEVGQR